MLLVDICKFKLARSQQKTWTVDGKSADLPRPHVEGNSAHSGVRDSNGVARRVAYLAQICIARGVEVIIEQPADSVLFNFPLVNNLLAWGDFVKVRTFMCAFHPLETDPAKVPRKEMQLWGTPSWMPKITTQCNHGRGTHLPLMTKASDGQGSSGTKAMKASQAYPPFFCNCIRDLHNGLDIDWARVGYMGTTTAPTSTSTTAEHQPKQEQMPQKQQQKQKREQQAGKRKMQSREEVETWGTAAWAEQQKPKPRRKKATAGATTEEAAPAATQPRPATRKHEPRTTASALATATMATTTAASSSTEVGPVMRENPFFHFRNDYESDSEGSNFTDLSTDSIPTSTIPFEPPRARWPSRTPPGD